MTEKATNSASRHTDVHRLLSANLIASLGSVAVSTMITVLLAGCSGTESLARRSSRRLRGLRQRWQPGLPIAAYALGDAALIAPMLLPQLIILQPIGLAVLDAITMYRAQTSLGAGC